MYQPEKKILKKYAKLLVNFALNDYKGINKGDTVLLQVPECAKPLLVELRNQVLETGGHPIIQYIPDFMARDFYEIATDKQLTYFPEKYLKGKIDQIDHSIAIIAEADKHELKGIPGDKIMKRGKAMKPYMEWREEKENKGQYTWTLAMYATPAMAAEAGLSLKDYWNEIIQACYLDYEDPVAEWKKTTTEIERVKKELNNLPIETLHLKAKDTDLVIGIGENREWMGGSGRNIPSYEVFISPNKYLTEGHIRFSEPLYRYGQMIKDIYLEFKEGKVVKSSASEGEETLKEMIKTEGADMIGEYSLTDSRLSKITKFMAETLFDENKGGKYGNTHLALGNAYKDSYPGDPSSVAKEEWKKMGYNESSVHTDIISTTDRTVTATLKSGEQKIIYKDGKFTV